MKPAFLVALLAVSLDLGLAAPMVPDGAHRALEERDPRGGFGGGGGLFGGSKPKPKPLKSDPPKSEPPKSQPANSQPTQSQPTKTDPAKGTSSNADASSTPSSTQPTSSQVRSSQSSASQSDSSSHPTSTASTTSSGSSQTTGSPTSHSSSSAVSSSGSSSSASSSSASISGKPSSTSGKPSSTTSGKSSSTTSASSTDPLAKSAWPRPINAGASPPTLQKAKTAKHPAFSKTKPKINTNNTDLYTSKFDQEAGVPLDLQKRSRPATVHPQFPLPDNVECPDTTADMTSMRFMDPIPAGAAMFYSGVDVGASRNDPNKPPPSKKFADEHNMGLLKDFVTQHAKDSNVIFNKNCPDFWTIASQYLAEQVQGNVAVLMNPIDTQRENDPRAWPFLGTKPASAWRKPEWPTLQKNTKVCSVWRFDVKGNAVMLLQRKGCDAKKPF